MEREVNEMTTAWSMETGGYKANIKRFNGMEMSLELLLLY